jgi:hypothetical protein
VYSYARMHYRAPSLLSRACGRVSRHLELLAPQDAANLMWGLAKLAYKPGPHLLDRLPHAVVGRLGEFKPQARGGLSRGGGLARRGGRGSRGHGAPRGRGAPRRRAPVPETPPAAPEAAP